MYYLSNYNKDYSLDFKYNNYYNKPEFFYYNGQFGEDSIYAYTDLNLKNLEKFKNISFYLENDLNDTLCSIIGFNPYFSEDSSCKQINIFKSFESNNIINSFDWILKYNNKDEGLLIFNPDLNKIINNYNKNKLFIFNEQKRNILSTAWSIIIDEIFSGNNNQTINRHTYRGEINNDFGLLQGDGDYYYYIMETYFKEYISEKKCTLENKRINYYFFFAVECDKSKFGIEDIKKFPILSLVSNSFQTKFTFDYNDLFTETKYKYFFNIIFNRYLTDRWILGKIFLRKYSFIINYDLKTIAYYNEQFELKQNYNNENKIILSKKIFFIVLLLGFILIIVFGIICFFIGKKFNNIKKRKRKINEINDDFDYKLSNDNKNNYYDDTQNFENKNY